MKKQLPFVAAAAGVLLLGLVGCTATDATSTPAPSGSPAAEAEEYVFPELDGQCVDGTATIGDDSSSAVITLGDCENVIVEASNSKIVLGAVTNLTVNSSISLVEAASVEHIVFGGQGNRVVTPGEPVVEGDLENNTVSAEAPVIE